jgi:nucleotide-binding universal stress UspA family protein
MLGIERILLPVDYSERSLVSAQYVKALACHFRSEIHLVHVYDYRLSGMLGLLEQTAMALPYDQRTVAEQTLERFLADSFAGLPVQRVLLEGDPAREIVKYAHSQHISLIVLPTHGYGPFRQFLLGSVTAKVLHDCQCPVLTGIHTQHAAIAGPVGFTNVLCAIDLGPHSSQALAWAWHFTQEVAGQLTVVHAIPRVSKQDEFLDADWPGVLECAAQVEIGKLMKAMGVTAEAVVEAGDVADAVASAASRLKADLLIISRGAACGVLGRLRTHSYAIIRKSPCPVLSV